MEKITNLLVTGGRGYVGSNTINTLFYLYPNINWIVVGLTKTCEKKTINKDIVKSCRYKYYQCNIGNKQRMMKILKTHNIEYVLDLAAFMPWELLKVSQEEFIENNITYRNTFLNTCIEYGKIKHIIYQSSFIAITNTLDNYNSTKNIYPKNIYEHILYNTTKSAGLSLAYNTLIMNRLPITIISPSHIYGGSNLNPEDFILTYIRELCETNKIVLGKNSNTNYDNWISVFDVIQAYSIIFSQGFNGKNYNPYNSLQYYTEIELAQMIVLAVKNTTDYSKYIKYDNSVYTFIPNFKDYKISTNFLPNQFTITNTFVEEVKKLAKCC